MDESRLGSAHGDVVKIGAATKNILRSTNSNFKNLYSVFFAKKHIFSSQKFKWRPFDEQRLAVLAKPRTPSIKLGLLTPPSDGVAKSALEYEPSSNVVLLATPLKRKCFNAVDESPDAEMYERPTEVPREYRKIQSVGIRALSAPRKPRKFYVKDPNASKIMLEISPNALKHKASAKTKSLAKPRFVQVEQPKENCFGVNPAALKKLPKKRQVLYDRLATPRIRKPN